jgi:hypothetical protein
MDALILPHHYSHDWLFARSRVYAEALNKPKPQAIGCELSGSFVLWFPSLKEDVLYITFSQFSDMEVAKKLIRGAAIEARYNGLNKIILWDPEHKWDKVEGANKSDRDDSLSSLVCFLDGQKVEGPLTWIKNEKYSWI